MGTDVGVGVAKYGVVWATGVVNMVSGVWMIGGVGIQVVVWVNGRVVIVVMIGGVKLGLGSAGMTWDYNVPPATCPISQQGYPPHWHHSSCLH